MNTTALYLLKRSANRQLFNPTTVKHHDLDCHIATAKKCGTHWIKYLLSLLLCHKYGLPLPDHIRDDAVVGHTKNRPVYNQIPQVAVTHSHPHYLLRMKPIYELIDLPRFVVLVRDPRAILVSSYEKGKGAYINDKMGAQENVSFARYLRGDVTGKTRLVDIWDLILFFNSWSAVIKAHPKQVLLIHYEDMIANTATVLRKVCAHIPIADVSGDDIAYAIENSSRRKMRKKLDKSEAQYEKSVNVKRRNFSDWYDDADRIFASEVLNQYIKDPFGYDFNDWP